MNRPARQILVLLALALLGGLTAAPARAAESDGPLATLRAGSVFWTYKGAKISYRDQGRGPKTLILLHGFGASAYSWHKITEPLARDYRVLTVDMRGMGLSDRPRDDHYSLTDQAAMVEALIAHLGLTEVTLIGNSMGGAVSLLTYDRLRRSAANPIKGLVLIDSTAYPETRPFFSSALTWPVIGRLAQILTPDRWIIEIMLRRCYADPAKITDEQRRIYTAVIAQPGYDYVLRQTARQFVSPETGPGKNLLAEVKVPTLIIQGEADLIFPPAVGQRLARDITGAELALLPACGHLPQEECPRATLHALQPFLKRVWP